MTDNIIHVGDFALRRQHKAYVLKKDECPHRRVVLDDNGGIVKCDDCGVQLSAYWAICMLTEVWEKAQAKLAREKLAVAEDKNASIHLIAARAVEKAWRSRSMVPSCPHCNRGIGPHDHFGATMVNAKMEQRRRDADRLAKETETRETT